MFPHASGGTCKYVHSCPLHKSQKLKITLMYIGWRINKFGHIHIIEYYTIVIKKQIPAILSNLSNLRNIMRKILENYGIIYKVQKQENPMYYLGI